MTRPLGPHTKKIYLDLNAASELALSTSGSEWAKLCEKLLEKCRDGAAVCPLPLETLAEASPCSVDQRRQIEEFFSIVSRGVGYRPFQNMIVNSTLALARPDWPVPCFVPVRRGWSEDEDLMSDVRHDRDNARDRMVSRMTGAAAPLGAEKMDVDKIYKKISQDRCSMAFRDFDRFQSDRPAEFHEYELPWLMEGVVRAGLDNAEAATIRQKILVHAWTCIPENFIDLRLAAQWEHDRVRKHRPNYYANDEIDRWRSAVALANSHLLVTDKYAAGLCQRSGVLGTATEITVLSVRQQNEFHRFLDQL